MMRVVLVTSNHERHRWVASQLTGLGMLAGVVVEEKPVGGRESDDALVRQYFEERDLREAYWFSGAPKTHGDIGVPVRHVPWGGSNSQDVFHFVRDLSPDRLALFGSGIIREPLLTAFAGNIINMHLGLSPYYRGSATNFWPLVHGLPECVGVTVHHATLKVDGGQVLGQRRPTVDAADSSHDLGCKAIIEGTSLLASLLAGSQLAAGQVQTASGVLCRRGDFTPAALIKLQANFQNGMLPRYIEDKYRRDDRYPIVT